MPISQESKASLMVILAAIGWGCIGLFAINLRGLGFSPIQTVALRAGGSTLIFFLYLCIRNREAFKIRLKDCKYFIGTGVFSFTFFNWFYFNAISLSSLPVAVVLLYTSPIFVLLMSLVFFKEKLTPKKIGAIALTFSGCALVAGLFEGPAQSISFIAALCGLASGFTFALYTVCGRMALERYSPITVTFYSFLFSFISVIPISKVGEMALLLANGPAFFNAGILVLFCTVIPFSLYTNGLKDIEASRAAVLATIEPIVACILGVFVLHEDLSLLKTMGIGLILSAVVLLSFADRSGKLKPKAD